MMKPLLLLTITLLVFNLKSTKAQFFQEDFDNDGYPSWTDTLPIIIDSTSSLWQIGPPQKTIFSESASSPNALLTDTINFYPENDTAVFYIPVIMDEMFMDYYWGIAALKWLQKTDIDSLDGGMVEFSVDNGSTWENVFTSPYVYNWYGFEDSDVDTLSGGEVVFSGTNPNWQEVWLCYEYGWMSTIGDTLLVKFSFITDSIPSENEGWIIDDMLLEPTSVHTVNEIESSEYLMLFPNPTNEILNIQLKKLNEFHIIEELIIYNESGVAMEEHSSIPTKFFIDVSNYKPGNYLVYIKSNKKEVTSRFVVSK